MFFNSKININIFYYSFLSILKPEILIFEKDKYVLSFRIFSIYKFTILFISHFISFFLTIDNHDTRFLN